MGKGGALRRSRRSTGVSFSTFPGECFGIVGTNGSGKSTVMQILGRDHRPSEGSMIVRGSVLPLLAVGLASTGN